MNVWKVKPTSANEVLPKEAIVILRQLERASNNKQRRRYNKILKRLRAEYPDKAAVIESHFITTNQKRKQKKTLLEKSMSLSPEEREWIRSWREIRGG